MTTSGNGPPHRFLFSVPDLAVADVWTVGDVELHPSGGTRKLVEALRESKTDREEGYAFTLKSQELLTLDAGTVALVLSGDGRIAYELADQALGVLRLFVAARNPTVDTDWQTFGLKDQLLPRLVQYIDLDGGPTFGSFRTGAAPGWTLQSNDLAAFGGDPGFQYLANGVRNAGVATTALQRRLQLGVRLINSSILDYDADRKLLSLVIGLEVLLGDSDWQGKKYGMSRRAAYFSCSVPQKSMCARDRPSCPYLAINPARRVPDALKTLVKRSETDVTALCSHYRFVFDLYDWRNEVVHEGTSGKTFDEVKRASWQVKQWLIPPLLQWCAAHQGSDIRDVDADIEAAVLAMPPMTPL
jgi:hypothetical protein